MEFLNKAMVHVLEFLFVSIQWFLESFRLYNEQLIAYAGISDILHDWKCVCIVYS